jgi:uncharacterized protein (UPF0212 family)
VLAPTASELLAAWEQGQARPPAGRAGVLLAAAEPGTPPAAFDALPVGDRDACLLSLRELTFGRGLTGVIDCPACGELVELSLAPAELFADAGPRPDQPMSLASGRHHVSFRLPTGGDLAAVAGEPDVATARLALLDRCLVTARMGPDDVPASDLPPDVVDAVSAAMADADVRGDVRLSTACPSCGHGLETAFDLAAFLWAEVDAWSLRALRDVSTLARAYGWREADILAMSPYRRQAYLELASA